MKFMLICLLALTATVYGRSSPVTDDLLSAQEDLSTGHEFMETILAVNRGQVSAYLERISRELIRSHINTYAFIRNTAAEVTEFLDGLTPTEENQNCVDRIVRRWELQITRFGQQLSQCIGATNTRLREWNQFLNNVHSTGQRTSNQVQNVGMSVLSRTEIFDGTDSFAVNINEAFRDLLIMARPYRDTVEAFLVDISGNILNLINELGVCDSDLEAAFEREVEDDLARARACVA